MNGGEISGNTAENTVHAGGGSGGGVYLGDSCSMAKTGGVIYGKDGGANSNTCNAGDYYGHAVFVTVRSVFRDTTAGPGVNLDSADYGSGWYR
jgi:hypothetical protein